MEGGESDSGFLQRAFSSLGKSLLSRIPLGGKSLLSRIPRETAHRLTVDLAKRSIAEDRQRRRGGLDRGETRGTEAYLLSRTACMVEILEHLTADQVNRVIGLLIFSVGFVEKKYFLITL